MKRFLTLAGLTIIGCAFTYGLYWAHEAHTRVTKLEQKQMFLAAYAAGQMQCVQGRRTN